MKIGIDIRHLTATKPSGIGQYTLRLIDALSQEAPDVTFLLFASGSKKTLDNLPALTAANVKLIKRALPNRLLYALMKLPFGVKLENLMKEKPDAWFFPNANIIRTALPYGITVHDLSFKFFRHFFTGKNRVWHQVANHTKLLKNATVILTVSQSSKQDLIETLGINGDKIFVTHLGVTPNFSSKILPQDKNYLVSHEIKFPYLLVLSTLEPRKNIESVIEAYGQWRQGIEASPPYQGQFSTASPPYQGGVRGGLSNLPHLVIAGENGWKNRHIEAAISRSAFQNEIHRIGYVPEHHKAALMRQAEVLLFPSYYEGFGLPALEAMASGTPVITSFTGSMPEVVADAGLMVDPYNVTDIAQALEQLLPIENGICIRSKTYLMLRERGIERAQTFTWYKTAEKTIEAMKRLEANG